MLRLTDENSIISIHSLHAEGDNGGRLDSYRRAGFQSTPSMRRETYAMSLVADSITISIHSLHAEGDGITNIYPMSTFGISIHSLHAEGDSEQHLHQLTMCLFQSTPSMRRETPYV